MTGKIHLLKNIDKRWIKFLSRNNNPIKIIPSILNSFVPIKQYKTIYMEYIC